MRRPAAIALTLTAVAGVSFAAYRVQQHISLQRGIAQAQQNINLMNNAIKGTEGEAVELTRDMTIGQLGDIPKIGLDAYKIKQAFNDNDDQAFIRDLGALTADIAVVGIKSTNKQILAAEGLATAEIPVIVLLKGSFDLGADTAIVTSIAARLAWLEWIKYTKLEPALARLENEQQTLMQAEQDAALWGKIQSELQQHAPRSLPDQVKAKAIEQASAVSPQAAADVARGLVILDPTLQGNQSMSGACGPGYKMNPAAVACINSPPMINGEPNFCDHEWQWTKGWNLYAAVTRQPLGPYIPLCIPDGGLNSKQAVAQVPQPAAQTVPAGSPSTPRSTAAQNGRAPAASSSSLQARTDTIQQETAKSPHLAWGKQPQQRQPYMGGSTGAALSSASPEAAQALPHSPVAAPNTSGSGDLAFTTDPSKIETIYVRGTNGDTGVGVYSPPPVNEPDLARWTGYGWILLNPAGGQVPFASGLGSPAEISSSLSPHSPDWSPPQGAPAGEYLLRPGIIGQEPLQVSVRSGYITWVKIPHAALEINWDPSFKRALADAGFYGRDEIALLDAEGRRIIDGWTFDLAYGSGGGTPWAKFVVKPGTYAVALLKWHSELGQKGGYTLFYGYKPVPLTAAAGQVTHYKLPMGGYTVSTHKSDCWGWAVLSPDATQQVDAGSACSGNYDQQSYQVYVLYPGPYKLVWGDDMAMTLYHKYQAQRDFIVPQSGTVNLVLPGR